MSAQQTALILGASRGLGLALAEEFAARGWGVVATVRSPSAGLDALSTAHPGKVKIETADIDRAEDIAALRRTLDGRSIDVVLVNAGIALEKAATPAQADEQAFLTMMRTNALAPVRALELLEDLVTPSGVLAVMSSELGSVAQNSGYWTLYSASKAALNMLMKGFAGSRRNDPRAMLLLAPGWVRTDMGGDEATLSTKESIPFVVNVIEANRGRRGLRYLDRFGDTVPW